MKETRNIIVRIENDFEHGYRESRINHDAPWTRDLHSDYVRNLRPFWFQKAPVDIMREDMGFVTLPERANEFAIATDNNPDLWYYLATASRPGTADEALKWVMGALAAELNIRKKPFTYLPNLLPALWLGMFVEAVASGKIDRTFTKAVMNELLANPLEYHAGMSHEMATEIFNPLIDQSRFKVLSGDDLAPVIDKIIADNPDQFEKAKTNPKLVQFFIGAAMKATAGKSPPALVRTMVEERLTH